jgi:hypothetical protein
MKNKRNTIIAAVLLIGVLSAAGYSSRQTVKLKDTTKNTDTTYNSGGNINPSPQNTTVPIESPKATASTGMRVPESSVSPGLKLNTLGSIIPSVLNVNGNTSSNLMNGGYLAYQEPWIYFSYPFHPRAGGLFRAMPDAKTGAKKLKDAQVGYINVVGDWVYFIDFTEAGIYKMTINGTDEIRLTPKNMVAHGLTVKEDWLYFADMSNGPTIYKMKLDGSELTRLAEGIRFSLCDDNWVYFAPLSEGHLVNLSRIRTDGTGEEVLYTSRISSFLVQGKWLYTVEMLKTNGGKEYTNALFRMNNDGTGKKKVIEERNLSAFNITDTYIYYSIYEHSKDYTSSHIDIYRMRLDGTGKLKLNQENVSSSWAPLYIAGDWIYLRNSGHESLGNFHRIKTDGSKELLVD